MSPHGGGGGVELIQLFWVVLVLHWGGGGALVSFFLAVELVLIGLDTTIAMICDPGLVFPEVWIPPSWVTPSWVTPSWV